MEQWVRDVQEGGGRCYGGDRRRQAEARGEEKEEVRKGEGHGCSKKEGREENQIFVSFPRPRHD